MNEEEALASDICSKCLRLFIPTPSQVRLRSHRCRDCRRETQRQWTKKNQSHVQKYARNRYKTHGDRNRLYAIWRGMISRCENPEHHYYSYYGGRGIRVCERWRTSFEAFASDMCPRPVGKFSLDRIDNNGPYCPENCRWATKQEQARNRRSSHYLDFQGQIKTIAEWSEITGIPAGLVSIRIVRLKWTTEQALTTPIMSPSEAAQFGNQKRCNKTEN